MWLSWKDIVATALLLIGLLISYALLMSLDWSVLANWRVGSLALLIVGIGIFIVAGLGAISIKNIWTIIAVALGVLVLMFAAAGMVFNSK